MIRSLKQRQASSCAPANPGGLRLNGIVYYYYIEGERNFDPLSRGMVDHADIDIVLRDMSGPRPLVIYRLRH